jgi:hypothetical protein
MKHAFLEVYKMRRITLIISILLLATLACNISLPDITMPEVDLSQIGFGSQQKINGSGKVVQEKRVIKDYTNVTLAGMGNLIMEQGDSEGINIEAEDNLIQFIRVEVINGKLIIGVQPGVNINPTQPINYHLYIKTVEGINLTGSGSIETPGIIGRTLTVNMSGSGHIKILKIDANSIISRLSGSGDIESGGVYKARTSPLKARAIIEPAIWKVERLKLIFRAADLLIHRYWTS